jgi:HEAT repeat protein
MRRSISLWLLLLLASPLRAAESTPPALATLTYSGDLQVLESLDREVREAGTDAAKLAALEQRLLALLRRPDATFAARQAISQRLGAVLAIGGIKDTGASYKPFAAMLIDERDSDLARLALEPVPGDVVDGLFVAALEKATGRSLLGLLDSIARRRTTAAVPSLSKLLKDTDAGVVAAAARALGEIADPTAVAALHATPEPSPRPIAAAKLAAASRMPPVAALGMLNELQRNARDPVHRAAAFRLSLDIEVGTAAERIAQVLGASNATMKAVALEALASSRAPNLVATLTGALPAWDAATQSAVIAALARRGDVAALPAIVTAAGHADSAVRTAAVSALGILPGTPDTATLLAGVAAGADAAAAKAARESLARLNGPDVSSAILAGATRGDPAQRAVFLEQLALRNMTEGLPLLRKARSDISATVRTAAVSALGDLAPPTEQKDLLDWAIEATDENEQTRALRAVVNVTLRNPNVGERGNAVYALIEFVQPELVLRLLPALTRIGGAASADSAARLAVRDDARVAEAATTALTRWPDSSALRALVNVAEYAAVPASRTAALEAAIRQFERVREPWTAASTELVSRLLASTTDVERRKQLVALLHRASDPAALTLVVKLKSDEALAAQAAIAEEVVRANVAGPARLRASPAASVANILDGKTSTRWSAPALGEEWVEVDFQMSRPVTRITLDQTGRAAEFPERYEVFVTDDPKQPGKAVVSGAGQRNKTVIDLPSGTRGRYLIVKNTAERKEAPWAICELYVD